MKGLRWGRHPAFWGVFLTAQLLNGQEGQEPNERCETSTSRLVVVLAPAATSANDVFPSFLRQFRAELANDKVGLCANLPLAVPPYFATLRLSWTEENGADLDVVARTRAQQTRLQRHVDLSVIPRNGWALALAIESDEMVRTGWARLDAAAKPPEPKSARVWWPAPTALAPVAGTSLLRPSWSPRVTFGSAIALEHYREGGTPLGVDVQGQWLGAAPFVLSGRFGLRDVLGGLTGSARAWLVGVGADVAVISWPQRAGLLGGLRADLLTMTRKNATESATGAWGVMGFGPSAWLALGELWRLQGELRLLVPLSHETRAGNLKGIGVSSSLGLMTLF